MEKEKYLKNYPVPISLENTEKIITQMRNNICKIYINGNNGTGFFCKIPFPDKNNLLTVFITNNHIINQDYLDKEENITISINNDKIIKTIKMKNIKKYTNEKYDITIIEIKKNEDNIDNYLELDEKIIENGLE